jgi:DUF917 family protein
MSFELNVESLTDLARGAAIMGTGGGGDPLVGRMLVEEALKEGLRVEVVRPEQVGDEELVIATAMMGAPSVVVEKLPSGQEAVASLRRLEAHLGRKASATIPMECGGLNSMIPLVVAARAGIPVIDGDGMGRAFPELQMETFGVYGVPGSPLVVSDAAQHTALIDTGSDNAQMESFARAVTIRMGGASYIAEYSMSGEDMKRTAIPGTLSLARGLGQAVRVARENHTDPFDALIGAVKDSIYGYARTLMTGKIVDVQRGVIEGFTAGRVVLEPFEEGPPMLIDFRNENIVARVDGRTVALVPDLIVILDADTATAITTEALRFGQRVRVLAIATPQIMRTEEALAVWGPRAFGIDEDWTPVEELAG